MGEFTLKALKDQLLPLVNEGGLAVLHQTSTRGRVLAGQSMTFKLQATPNWFLLVILETIDLTASCHIMNIQLIIPDLILIPALLNHSHFQMQVAELMPFISNATTYLNTMIVYPISPSFVMLNLRKLLEEGDRILMVPADNKPTAPPMGKWSLSC